MTGPDRGLSDGTAKFERCTPDLLRRYPSICSDQPYGDPRRRIIGERWDGTCDYHEHEVAPPPSAPLAELREALVGRLRGATELADNARRALSDPHSNAAHWSERLTHYRGYQEGVAWAIEEVDRRAADPT